MLIIMNTDYIKKLRVVNALLCWLQSCRFGTRAVCTVCKMFFSYPTIMMHGHMNLKLQYEIVFMSYDEVFVTHSQRI